VALACALTVSGLGKWSAAGRPFESWISTMPANGPVFGALRLRFALEAKLIVPTVPPPGGAVRMIVTPAPPLLQVVH
jgi:hypothetical protein